ncbi:aminoglycoside phosphotransferase [Streptomyces sp. NPDC047022]|uniref:aminoglycoside phosphotransferase n=1 Tax=Streptomyces sp. NPDC047022 TaxID=3155737 RepID=UPI0033DF0262
MQLAEVKDRTPVSVPRRDFHALPTVARHAVTRFTGPVTAAYDLGEGTRPGLAAVVETLSGNVFVKGIQAGDPRAGFRADEAAVNPHLPAVCPRLLWQAEAGGWLLAGYEFIEGRHADYATDAADLVAVLTALAEVQQAALPDGTAIRTADERWAAWAPEGTAHLFAGRTLLHTDLAPDSVLIDGNSRAHMVSWSSTTAGAPWIDPYLLALRIVEAGQGPGYAITWVSRLASWRTADPKAVAAFATAVTRARQETADAEPAPRRAAGARHAARLEAFLAASPWALPRR